MNCVMSENEFGKVFTAVSVRCVLIILTLTMQLQGTECQNTCFKNSWYTFTKWGSAEWNNSEICRDQGGDLASIETEEEWKFINQEIKKRSTWNVSAWHIGLEKGTDGSWTWKSGTQLNISKWRNCEISGNGKFAEVSKNGSLKAIPETNSKAFLCEIPEVCPNTSFKDSWYTFTNGGKTWNKNREICQSQGGDLVSIETEEEWNYITKEIQKHNISSYHIGLEQRDNNWTWLNGRPLTIWKWRKNLTWSHKLVASILKSFNGSSGLFENLHRNKYEAYICEFHKVVTSSLLPSPAAASALSASTWTQPSLSPLLTSSSLLRKSLMQSLSPLHSSSPPLSTSFSSSFLLSPSVLASLLPSPTPSPSLSSLPLSSFLLSPTVLASSSPSSSPSPSPSPLHLSSPPPSTSSSSLFLLSPTILVSSPPSPSSSPSPSPSLSSIRSPMQSPTPSLSSSRPLSTSSSSSFLLAPLPPPSLSLMRLPLQSPSPSLSSSSLISTPSLSSFLLSPTVLASLSLLSSSYLLSSPPTSTSSSFSFLFLPSSRASSSPSPSPSPSLSLKLSSSSSSPSTSRTIQKLANEYVTNLARIDVTNKSSLQEAMEVFEDFFTVIKNIARPPSVEETETRRKSIFKVAVYLETLALNYSKYHLIGTKSSEEMESNKMVLVIQKAYRQNATEIYFEEQKLQASMKVPSKNFVNNVSLVVGIVYKDLHEILLTEQTIRNETGRKRILGSRIMAIAMDPKSHKLQENIILKFRNLEVYKEGEKKCAFWSGLSESADGFSERGCHVVTSKNNLPGKDTVCSCNHLTHFAVLVDYNGIQGLTKEDITILEIITYVGLSLSMTGIYLTIIVYSFLTDVRQPLSQIRLSLSVAIGAGQIIFLAGINATENEVACVSVAALMQYFLIVAFCWMLVEGIYLYLFFVKVYNIAEKMHMYHVISWGLPMIMVGISLSIAAGKEGIQSYTGDEYCWLSSTNKLIWIFIAFVAFIEVLNVLILVRVIKEMTRLVQQMGEDDHVMQIRLGIRTCAVMIPLLGVTWLFGLLLQVHKAFAYIFTILNSTQGFLIFALHCIGNSQIRERFKRKMNIIFPSKVDHGNSVKKTPQVNPSGASDMWAVELQYFNE